MWCLSLSLALSLSHMATKWQVVYTPKRLWTKEWFTSLVGKMVFHHSMQFKTYEFFISEIFHLIFLNHG